MSHRFGEMVVQSDLIPAPLKWALSNTCFDQSKSNFDWLDSRSSVVNSWCKHTECSDIYHVEEALAVIHALPEVMNGGE